MLQNLEPKALIPATLQRLKAKLASPAAVFSALRTLQPKSLFQLSSEKAAKHMCDVLDLTLPLCPSLAVRKHSLRVPCRHCNIHFRAAIFPVSAHHIVSDLGFFLQKRYASSSPTGDFQVEGSYWELPLLLGSDVRPDIRLFAKGTLSFHNVLLLAYLHI